MSCVAARGTKRSGGGGRGASRSVEVLQLILPGLGAELEDVASGVAAHTHDDVAQVLEGVDAVQLAGGEERVEDAASLGAIFASGEEPVFAPDRNSKLILPMPHLARRCTTRGTRPAAPRSTFNTVKSAVERRSSSARSRTTLPWSSPPGCSIALSVRAKRWGPGVRQSSHSERFGAS
jgi:hypothetical protein